MIRILDSHAYPGCGALAEALPEGGPVHVEFSDGMVVGAIIEPAADGCLTLTIDAYRTGKGTAILRKSWLLERHDGDRWRVSRRLDTQ